MAEYIERKRLEEAFDNADPDVCESYPDGYSDWGFGRKNVREVISSVPAADVAPVVQGRGTREGESTMNISEAVDRAVKAKWRADLVNMLTDAGRTLEHANLRANGSVYQDINVGLLLLEAARSLQECQDEPEPENPDDVVVKVTVPDRWPMTEAGQRWAAQEAAADVAPVRHGRWETHYRSGTTVPKGVVSGCCDMWNERKTPYCPYCGAKLDGGAENG